MILDTLNIIIDTMEAPTTMDSLCALTGLSRRQVIRGIEEARELGADIVSNNAGRNSRWVCRNAEELEHAGIVRKWRALEEDRSVVELRGDLELCWKVKGS